MQEGQSISQGTCWALNPHLVVTAFHVVGELKVRGWHHEREDQVTYHIMLPNGDAIALEPAVYDPTSDVAALRTSNPLPIETLLLSQESISDDSRWRASGFPGHPPGKVFTLSGIVVTVRESISNRTLQLLVEQGTSVSWSGMSGAPVTVDGDVIGVITQATSSTKTMWAATATAVQALSDGLSAASYIDPTTQLLLSLYGQGREGQPHADIIDELVGLCEELDWGHGLKNPSQMQAAEVAHYVAQRSVQEGYAGLSRLLDGVSRDHPASPDIIQLRMRFEVAQQPEPQAVRRPRFGTARSIVQYLQRESNGVAVIAPSGYRVRDIIDQTMALISSSDSKFLSIRLIPDRRNQEENRHYRTLLRNLRRGLEAELGRPLTPRWHQALNVDITLYSEEQFEMAIENLMDPVEANDRWLLLRLDEIARVHEDHLTSWSHLLARLLSDLASLKILVWGEGDIHTLCTQSTEVDTYSVFHVLEKVYVGPYEDHEVALLLEESLGQVHESIARTVFELTAGNPSLVDELVNFHADEVLGGEPDGIKQRLLGSSYLLGLRKRLDALPEVTQRLKEMVGGNMQRSAAREAEYELEWMGITRDAGATQWQWVSPVMSAFAKELCSPC